MVLEKVITKHHQRAARLGTAAKDRRAVRLGLGIVGG
jgi:hypothetical protein